MAKRKQGWKKGRARGKKSKVPNPEKPTFGDNIVELNESRNGEKRKSVFSNKHYGKVILFLLSSDKKEIYLKDIPEEIINESTWTNQCRDKLRDMKVIRYKKKNGGRNSKFTINRLKLEFLLTEEFIQFLNNVINPEIREKQIKYLRKLFGGTKRGYELLINEIYNRNDSKKQELAIFKFFLESISNDKNNYNIDSELELLNFDYMKLSAEAKDKKESKKVEEKIKLLEAKRKKVMEDVKKKCEYITLSFTEIRLYLYNQIDDSLRDIENKIDCSVLMEFVKSNILFCETNLRNKAKFSIYDIFKEVLLKCATEYNHLKTGQEILSKDEFSWDTLEYVKKDTKTLEAEWKELGRLKSIYNVAWLYETFVAFDFEDPKWRLKEGKAWKNQ